MREQVDQICVENCHDSHWPVDGQIGYQTCDGSGQARSPIFYALLGIAEIGGDSVFRNVEG
jgi:hypothetical protein